LMEGEGRQITLVYRLKKKPSGTGRPDD